MKKIKKIDHRSFTSVSTNSLRESFKQICGLIGAMIVKQNEIIDQLNSLQTNKCDHEPDNIVCMVMHEHGEQCSKCKKCGEWIGGK